VRHVPIAAFKDRLSEYVDAVEAGEEVIITRHGKPTVRMTPIVDEAAVRQRRRDAVETLLAFRETQRAKGNFVTAEEWIAWKNEGRP
jgi:prevent-host-death family protein